MIVALCSVRGSPGVSAWSMMLAAAWPADSDRERVVLEADPDGGVAGARYGVGVEPGVADLVTGCRHGAAPGEPLQAAGRWLDSGTWLVPGPVSADDAHRLWSADRASHAIAASIEHDERAWLCDVGRARALSAVAPFIAQSIATLLLTRDEPSDLVQVPDRVSSLRTVGASVGVMVVGRPSYDRDELSEFFGDCDVWVVPFEPRIVDLSRQVFSSSGRAVRRIRRTLVWACASEIAADLADRVPPPPHVVQRPLVVQDGR